MISNNTTFVLPEFTGETDYSKSYGILSKNGVFKKSMKTN